MAVNRSASAGEAMMTKEWRGTVSEHLKTKERTARNSTNSEEQGEWWAGKSDYGLGTTRVNAQGAPTLGLRLTSRYL